MVSITDHDTIEASLQLQMIAENDQVPISVEWTTPYQDTYFHVGVHNMHPDWAPQALADMQRFTDDPKPGRLRPVGAPPFAGKGIPKAHVTKLKLGIDHQVPQAQVSQPVTGIEGDPEVPCVANIADPGNTGGDFDSLESVLDFTVKQPDLDEPLVVLAAVLIADLELPALPGHKIRVAADNFVILADGGGEILKIQLADAAPEGNLDLVARRHVMAEIETGAKKEKGP